MSTAADRLVSRIRPELTKAAAAENLAAATAAAERALEILRPFAERAKKAKAVSRALPKPLPPGKTKAERKEERNERAAEIRAEVMKRADGRCEWCQADGMALEWHHIFSGGARRHMEAVDTTVGVCWDCHRAWERNSMSAFMPAANWAMRYGFTASGREIQRRIDHMEGVRRG